MTRRVLTLLAVSALFISMLPAAAQSSGQASFDRAPRTVSNAGNIVPLGDPDEVIEVVIEFDRPSVGRFIADRIQATGVAPSGAQRKAQADAIDRQHAAMRSSLDQYVISETGTMRTALNAFQVRVRRGDTDAIAATPGVARVSRVVLHERTHTNSVPWIGAPTVWAGTPGVTGEGVSIAVIDTGIDYHHATFGGSGDPADFNADDGLSLIPGVFPNDKIVGGIDLAGDAYDGDNLPQPDPSPLDCNGHGTHVAGTAAGFGVNSDGSTYTGEYDASTFTNGFRVGPGVAPEADIYGIRVFGCEGSTGLVALAIEWAMDPDGNPETNDAVDVINMSLGSNYGEPYDSSATAAQNAVDAGIIVVASAGNAGNVPYITGSPATAPGAISVAANSAGGFQDALAIEVLPQLPPAADWQPAEGQNAWWATGRGTCDGWEIRNNYNLFAGTVNPPATQEEYEAITIRILVDGDEVEAALPAGEIFSIPDASEDTELSVQWGMNATENLPAGGLITLNMTRDFTGCDDPGHGLEGLYAALEAAFGEPLWSTGDVTGELALVEPLIACEAGDVPRVDNPEEIAGKIAVATRGTCSFFVKYDAVRDAGAIGLIVVNNAAGPPIVMGGEASSDTIPAVMISQADGTPIITALQAETTVEVTMSADNAIQIPLEADQIATFTSRGPGRGGSTFKPEVTAPGVAINSASVGSGTRGEHLQGTSMAAPHVAGVAALMRAVHPELEVDAIKALIMNSGRAVAPASTPAARQGTGQVSAGVAASLGAYAGPAGIAFGRLNPGDAFADVQEVTVTNLEATAKTFAISVEQPAASGVTVSAPAEIEVGAEGTATFEVRIDLDPSEMASDDAWMSHAEAWGVISLSDGDDDLTLAYNAVIDPASAAHIEGYAGEDFWVENYNGHDAPILVFSGAASVDDGSGVEAVVGGSASAELIVFGLAVEDHWEAPSSMVVDLYLDVDQDGTDDYLVRTVDHGVITGAGFNGNYVSVTYDLGTGSGAITHFAEVDYNDRVMGFISPKAMLGGLDAGAEVNFFIDVWDIRTEISTGLAIGSMTIGLAGFGSIDGNGHMDMEDAGPFGVAGATWLFPTNMLEDQVQVVEGEPATEDTAGAFDPNTGQWHLRDINGEVTSFYFGAPGDRPLMGDWDGDGYDSVGVYRPSNQTVYLRNDNSTGAAEHSFVIGNPGDIAVAGDWDGDGLDTVSLYRPTTGQVFIFNSISTIVVVDEYYFGDPGDKPFSGDFDADGVDTFGLHRESTGLVYFTNGHETAVADNEFYFGIPGDRLIAGDWGDVDFIDTPGVFRPSNTTWYFRHTNTQGFAESEFVWGQSHWLPVAGDFGLGGIK